MTRALALAAALLLAACGSDNSDVLPDDLASAEGSEAPLNDIEIEAEPEPEPEPVPAAPAEPAIGLDQADAPDLAEPDTPAEAPRASLPKPSFDCGGALNRVEAMICADPELARLDRRLARDYDRALGQASPSERQRLTNLGRRYLADRNRCSTRDCVLQAYRWYLRDIETLAGQRNP